MIYGRFLDEHPDSVAGVAIRRLLPTEAVLAGLARAVAASEYGARRGGAAPRALL